MIARVLVVSVLLCLGGCASSRQITELSDILPEEEVGLPQHQTVDAVRKYYFTDEAYQALKDIPVIDGPAFSGYAAGVTWASNLASIVSFNGWGRKTILPARIFKKQGVAALIHEDIHHLDDMDRDGEAEFIDHQDFWENYLKLAKDSHHAGIVIYAEQRRRQWQNITDLFGVGKDSERIAYVGEHLATKKKDPKTNNWDDLPIKKTFSKILSFKEYK